MHRDPLPLRRVSTAAAVAALLAASPLAAQDGFRPQAAFLQLNDVYRIDAVENGAAGGLGRTVTVVERTRRETHLPTMVLHAGDMIAPSLESRYFAGQQMIDALNFVAARAPLLVVPGNHEFDEKEPGMLAGALKASRFPWMAGNARLHTGDPAADARLSPRDTVLSMGDLKVGVFTLTYIDAPRGYVDVDTAYVAAAERQIRALEARGADAIVGLTHLDHAVDRRIAALRRTHPRLVWIAGGHEHFLIRDDLSDSTALITKGDSNARRIWRVLLGRGAGGAPTARGEVVVLDSTVAVDPAYQREVQQKWAARIREKIPFFDTRIGTSTTRLDGTEETVRNAESSWGSWLADQMRTTFPDVRTDVAVLNGGAIRVDDAFTGEIRWEHLARTFGFPTRVGLVWLRGRDLRELVLERAVSGGRGEGRFLQVSGVRFTFDRRLPVGDRVTAVQVQEPGGSWAALDDARVYTVAVPDYLYGGGDGYTFKNAAIMTVPPGPDVRLAAFDALAAAYAQGRAIAPQVEGRITEVK
jgi:5'-nucleotidase